MEKQLRNYNEEGLRLRNKRKYLLYKLKLLELEKYKREELYLRQQQELKKK